MRLLGRRTAIASIVLITAFGTSAVPVSAAAAADTTPPELRSISLSRESITVSGLAVELLTVSVRLTDDVGVVETDTFEGDHYPSVIFGGPRSVVRLDFGTGTPEDGVWTGVVAVTSEWDGTVQPVLVYAIDEAGNTLSVDPRTVVDTPAVTVRGSNQPVLTLTMTPDPATPNGAITRTVRVTDKTTGRPWPNLRIEVADEIYCSWGGTERTTDQNGVYRQILPAGQLYPYLMCAWVPTENVPGQRPTRLSFQGGSVRYRFAVSAVPAATSAPAGSDVDVNGTVSPPVEGKTVQLQRLTGATQWRTVNTALTRASSRYTVVATPPGVGNWTYRVVAPGADNTTTGTSPTFAIRGT